MFDGKDKLAWERLEKNDRIKDIICIIISCMFSISVICGFTFVISQIVGWAMAMALASLAILFTFLLARYFGDI